MMRVRCLLKDCVFFNKPSDPKAPPEQCDCAHPDKAMYMQNLTCPLYKKDWGKLNTADLAARFARKNRF